MAACKQAGTGLWVRQVQKCLPKSALYRAVGRIEATGWLSGSHPTVNQGAVRRRVCFHWAGHDI